MKSREEQDDEPPMSRLFIICNKTNTEDEFRESFSKFGTIEEIWIVKDKLTGEHKGQWSMRCDTAMIANIFECLTSESDEWCRTAVAGKFHGNQ